MSNYKHWNVSIRGMVFDPQSGDSFQVNEVAQVMLLHFREGKKPEEIARLVSDRFGITYERALTDVLDFLVQLESMSSAA